ncbi:hypothetical protein EVG20_g10918 [Dentipellis fragilis]|uniref:Uncharacterized protein n=1 Tax=Dentipellis fragilis TaxID=205917 RepID=A0A4Y9XQG8_9AGAM|nr:hypothetical protein EVG20_g10918 [Dentipellis fragilis]
MKGMAYSEAASDHEAIARAWLASNTYLHQVSGRVNTSSHQLNVSIRACLFKELQHANVHEVDPPPSLQSHAAYYLPAPRPPMHGYPNWKRDQMTLEEHCGCQHARHRAIY